MVNSSMRNLVGQIHRQFENLTELGDGREILAMKNQSIILMTESELDVVRFPCDLGPDEPRELLEGLTIEIAEVDGEGWFIVRMESKYREIFIPFIADVCGRFRDSGMPNAFDETMEDWRVLWSGKRGRLNKSQQRGLLGELAVLLEIIRNGTEAVVQSWVGPLRELHDFRGKDMSIEVKTTTLQPPSVRISKVAQMAPFVGSRRLLLLVVCLEQGTDLSLVSIVKELRGIIEKPSIKSHFENVLRRAGYRDEHEQYYRSTYSIGCFDMHWVTDESPVLDPSFLSDVPATVRDIRYTLDVFAMEMLRVNINNWSDFSIELRLEE